MLPEMNMERAKDVLQYLDGVEPLRAGRHDSLLGGSTVNPECADTYYYGGTVLAEGCSKHWKDTLQFIIESPMAIRFLLQRVEELERIIIDCDLAGMARVASDKGQPLMINNLPLTGGSR